MAPTIEHNENFEFEPISADEPSQGVERAVPQPDADGRLIVTADDGDRQVDVTGMGSEEARIVRKYGLTKRENLALKEVTYQDDFYRLVRDKRSQFDPLSVRDGSSGFSTSTFIKYKVSGPVAHPTVTFTVSDDLRCPLIDYSDPAWRDEVERKRANYEQVRRSADWMQELVDAEVV